MLEVKYYRDYRRNYMILQCDRAGIQGSYQYRILTSGKIEDILRCSVRHINGMIYYYYDISSRTTLEHLYRGKKMSYEQVKDLLLQLHGICDRLSDYFMEENGLVLLPEHIYYDLSSRKYIGLFYPDYHVTGSDAYVPLMDFLLEHIDTEDQLLTENMYNIYEMAEAPGFSMEDALQMLEDKEKPIQEAAETEPEVKPELFHMTEESYVLPEEKPNYEDTKTPKRSVFYSVFAVLSALGIAGALMVHRIYELTREEEIALYGSMTALGLCLLVCLAGARRGGRKTTAGKNGAERDATGGSAREIQEPFDRYLPEAESFSLEHVISRDMDLEMIEQRPMPNPSSEQREAQADNDCGNTVFYDDSRMQEYKLYAMDRINKKHIELKRFPCTVGKMAGCVDHVLSDASVSRIHARFDRQGETILLTDMNSTNGTYKNGLRMQPQETVEIEPGDEVRFGSLNYCYR